MNWFVLALLSITFQLFKLLYLADKGLVPDMRIWSILINSDLKLCIHLGRSFSLYFNHLVIVTAGGLESRRVHMLPSSTVDFGWFVAFLENHNFPSLKLIEIVIFITLSLLASATFGTFDTPLFKILNYFVWLRITDEGSALQMSIWSILIKSELQWCINLGRRLFLYWCSFIELWIDVNFFVSKLVVW